MQEKYYALTQYPRLAVKKALAFLEEHDFIQWNGNAAAFAATKLGLATFASSLSPDEGLVVKEEVGRARDGRRGAAGVRVTRLGVTGAPGWEVSCGHFTETATLLRGWNTDHEEQQQHQFHKKKEREGMSLGYFLWASFLLLPGGSFNLNNELHLVYHLTPVFHGIEPDWKLFYWLWSQLPKHMTDVARALEVEESV